MPDAVGRTIHEVLIAPLPLLLTQTAAAVAQAQVSLDEAAMQTQEQLDALTRQAQAEVPRAANRPAWRASRSTRRGTTSRRSRWSSSCR
jgi:hypothetical protein